MYESTVQPPTMAKNNDPVERIIRYIRDHLTEDLSHKRLMTVLGVTNHVLVSVFPRQTGQTVTAYVIDLRLSTVLELVKTGMLLEEAAEKAGFQTYSHFYKVFVKRFGVSPSVYLKKEKRGL